MADVFEVKSILKKRDRFGKVRQNLFFGFLVFIRKIYLILFLCRLNIWSSGRILRPPKVHGNESKIWIAPKFSLNSSLTDWKRLLVCSCCLIWMDFIVPNCAISYRHCLQTFYCCHIIIFKIKSSTNSRFMLKYNDSSNVSIT